MCTIVKCIKTLSIVDSTVRREILLSNKCVYVRERERERERRSYHERYGTFKVKVTFITSFVLLLVLEYHKLHRGQSIKYSHQHQYLPILHWCA